LEHGSRIRRPTRHRHRRASGAAVPPHPPSHWLRNGKSSPTSSPAQRRRTQLLAKP
jgi:hypothetical protein